MGTYYDATGSHGFLLAAGTFTSLDPLGVSDPTGINDRGQIVGRYQFNTNFLIDGTTVRFFSVPGPLGWADFQVPMDINNDGQIAGWVHNDFLWYWIPGTPCCRHGFVMDSVDADTYTMLDYLSADTYVTGINDRGQIVGVGPDGLFVASPAPETVPIDIKPGTFPNPINLRSAGTVPVAILSTPTFDAQQVNPETVTLAGASVKQTGKRDRYSCSVGDVNGDGLPDLLCHVVTAQFALQPGESIAVLEAETFSGQRVRGEDSVQIVPQQHKPVRQ